MNSKLITVFTLCFVEGRAQLYPFVTFTFSLSKGRYPLLFLLDSCWPRTGSHLLDGQAKWSSWYRIYKKVKRLVQVTHTPGGTFLLNFMFPFSLSPALSIYFFKCESSLTHRTASYRLSLSSYHTLWPAKCRRVITNLSWPLCNLSTLKVLAQERHPLIE